MDLNSDIPFNIPTENMSTKRNMSPYMPPAFNRSRENMPAEQIMPSYIPDMINRPSQNRPERSLPPYISDMINRPPENMTDERRPYITALFNRPRENMLGERTVPPHMSALVNRPVENEFAGRDTPPYIPAMVNRPSENESNKKNSPSYSSALINRSPAIESSKRISHPYIPALVNGPSGNELNKSEKAPYRLSEKEEIERNTSSYSNKGPNENVSDIMNLSLDIPVMDNVSTKSVNHPKLPEVDVTNNDSNNEKSFPDQDKDLNDMKDDTMDMDEDERSSKTPADLESPCMKLPTLPILFEQQSSSETQPNSLKNCPEIQSKDQTFSNIITDIINVCEKQVFGQTTSIQTILNVCSKIMNIPGCLDFCNEISSACNQILSDTYQNSHAVIGLCKTLSGMETEVPKKNTKKKPTQTKPSTAINKPEETVKPVENADWQETVSYSGGEQDDESSDADDLKKDPSYNRAKNKKYKGLKTGCKPSKKKGKNNRRDRKSTIVRGKFQCTHCPKLFFTLRSFERHQYLQHTKVTCEICGAELKGACLNKHMLRHKGEKPFICDICGSGFLDKDCLNGHLLVHTNEKPVKCELCDYACKSEKRLRLHMVCHSTVRKYQCEECGSRFLRNNDLKAHLAVHRDVWPFSCSICGKKFKTKYRLGRHDKVHTNIYLHQCSVCGKKIRQYSNLKIHMRTHSGEKPYLCEFCGQGFAHNVTRKHHQGTCGNRVRADQSVNMMAPWRS